MTTLIINGIDISKSLNIGNVLIYVNLKTKVYMMKCIFIIDNCRFFIKILVTILGFSCVSLFCAAEQIDIYRWIDKDNIVHFSQNLPAAGSYTNLSTVSSYYALSKDDRKKLKQEESDEQKINERLQENRNITNKNKTTFKQNCIAAKQNIKMLTSFDEVLITEVKEGGKKVDRVLNEKEKQQKLELSNKHVELYCK